MKCPICDGGGRITSLPSGMPVKCTRCNGTGEVEMTNEEMLRGCTFEELAGAIYEWYTLGYTRGKNCKKLNSITEVVEWLKEKHNESV